MHICNVESGRVGVTDNLGLLHSVYVGIVPDVSGGTFAFIFTVKVCNVEELLYMCRTTVSKRNRRVKRQNCKDWNLI